MTERKPTATESDDAANEEAGNQSELPEGKRPAAIDPTVDAEVNDKVVADQNKVGDA